MQEQKICVEKREISSKISFGNFVFKVFILEIFLLVVIFVPPKLGRAENVVIFECRSDYHTRIFGNFLVQCYFSFFGILKCAKILTFYIVAGIPFFVHVNINVNFRVAWPWRKINVDSVVAAVRPFRALDFCGKEHGFNKIAAWDNKNQRDYDI